jgi:TetR/AcrR family transcriptional regulator
MNPRPKSLGTRNQPEQTKAAILRAALTEFANMGLSGGRTDAIAQTAGVNKALLYYYFKDKETLYGATLESVFAGTAARLSEALDRTLPPREKLLAFAGAYFDAVASNPLFPRLVQQEMMRAGTGLSPHLLRIVEKYQRPVFAKVMRMFDEGIRAGEFRKVDVLQFVPSMVAMIVHYFSSTPMMRAFMPGDPLSPERIAARRVAVLDFISAAIFVPEAVPERGPRLPRVGRYAPPKRKPAHKEGRR